MSRPAKSDYNSHSSGGIAMSAFFKSAGTTLAAIAVGLAFTARTHLPAPASAGTTTIVAGSGPLGGADAPNSLIWD